VLATARVRGGRRWALLAAFACGLPFFDNSVGVLIPLLTLVWLLPRDAAPWQRLLAVLWLALFAHFKFTFCLQALASLLIATTTACIERRFRDAALVLLASTFAYVGFWIAAGQSLANLPAFWQLSWNLGSGYSWAMSSAPSTAALAAGIFTLAICAAFLRLIWHADLPLTQRLAAAAIALANGFMAWKHGFTRGDHTFAFFFFCLFFGLLLAGLFSRRRGLVWHDLNVLGCLAGIAIASSGLLLHGPRTALDHWLRFPYELTHLDAWTARFHTALRQTEATAHDPALVAAVGDATVDLINYDQWSLLLNGLNYRPRPIPQSYAAYTETLLETNAAFFRSERAPEFVVLRLGAIDGRYPGQEDSLALAELARRYEISLRENTYTLLRRKPASSIPSASAPTLLDELTPHYGRDLAVPDGGKHPVWIEVDFRPTWLGRLHTFIYHASLPSMIATLDNAQQKRFRVLPSTSRQGFFIQPLLETHADFAALIEGSAFNRTAALRFELTRSFDRWLWRRPRVRFFALPDLPSIRSSLREQRDHTRSHSP
jgi:hypothetical protein